MIGYVAGLIVVSIVISYLLKKEIEYIIPMSVLLSIVLLYFFGIANALSAGVYVLYFAAFAGLVAFAYLAFKHKKDFFKSIPLTPVIIFIVFTLISLWAQWGRVLSLWDEFSHWGRVVKDMVYNNRYATHADTMVHFQNYPPATALLQYLFINIRGAFVEAEIIHAMNIIYFALMMPFFRNIKPKNVGKIVAIMLIILILPTGFYVNMFSAIYVDGLLAIMFAYILISYFTNKLSRFNFINIALALFVLTLTKPSGIGIAGMAAIVVYADFLIVNKKGRKAYVADKNKLTGVSAAVLPIFCLLLAKYSWDIYLQATNANIVFDTATITLDKIVDVFFRFNGNELQKGVLSGFLEAFTTTSKTASAVGTINFVFTIPPFTYFIIFLFIDALFFYKEKEASLRKRIVGAGISLLVVGALFFVSLLISYTFLFGDGSMVALPAFMRYSGTYFLGVYTLIVAYMLHKDKDESKVFGKIPKYVLILFVIFLITGLKPFLNTTILAPYNNKYSSLSRDRFNDITHISDVVEDDEKVYYLEIGGQGFSYWVSSYEVYPIRISKRYSIGEEPYYYNDIWTREIPPDELAADLHENYQYVYIYKTGYDFAEKYGHLFGGAENVEDTTLYRVEKTDDNVSIIKVDN